MPNSRSSAQSSALAFVLCLLLVASRSFAQAQQPEYLRDRGEGIATSILGTYVEPHQWLTYLFYEYTLNRDQEYKPAELGFGLDQDFRAKSTEHEFLLFYAFGVSDRFEFELESALHASATQEKAADDPSAMPSSLHESGLGDTEGQVRWRFQKETANRPELFSYTEVVFPFQRTRKILGTQNWEFAQGFGLVKGSRLGTVLARAAVSYSVEESELAFGEYALEYIKQASKQWRWIAAVEGEQDEVAAIGEAQFHPSPEWYFKFNDAIGLTSKAPDQAPEVGIVFLFQ